MTEVGAGGVGITVVRTTRRFDKDFQKLPSHIRDAAAGKLQHLYDNPRPPGLRFEKLNGYRRPDIFTIHITPNYKISMEINGSEATLRRAGKHKEIDRRP